MSKTTKHREEGKVPKNTYKKLFSEQGLSLYQHQNNGLQVLHLRKPDTDVITSNITYRVGSVDEERGQSGIAHMLEHMLFKPTKQDIKASITEGEAMQFERDTGSILNANTSYDRTTYYYSFAKTHLNRVLKLEANRMNDVLLNDESFQPERSNVLSEFDMYNSNPYFALELAVRGTAFQSHAYGHEVLGYREDIEDYTTEKLQRFYDMFYRPDNAVLMLVGDLTKTEALEAADTYFGSKKNPKTEVVRQLARESKQVGIRRTDIVREGTTNIVCIGFKHQPFPSKDWFATNLALEIIAGGPESILHKALVDSGKVTSLEHYVWTTAQPDVGMLFIKLAPDQNHADIEKEVLTLLNNIKAVDIATQLKKEKVKLETEELFDRISSLQIVSDLTQYVRAEAITEYHNSKKALQAVTTKDVLRATQTLFTENNLTIGTYRSV